MSKLDQILGRLDELDAKVDHLTTVVNTIISRLLAPEATP